MLKKLLGGLGNLIASSLSLPKQSFSDSTLEAPTQAGVNVMTSLPNLRPSVLVDFHRRPGHLNDAGEILLREMDRVVPRAARDRDGILREAFLHGLTPKMKEAGRVTAFDPQQKSGRAIQIDFGPPSAK